MNEAPQLYSAKSARLLFVTGAPASVREGSGTYVGISALRQALVKYGYKVELLAPSLPLGSVFSRLWFNVRAFSEARMMRPDVVVGFDLDGLFGAPHGTLDVASIKGVIAEELRFEKGIERVDLLLQSHFELRRVRRADRIVAPSKYAADAIERCYGVPVKR
jgi:hypothetical protein